MRVRDKNQAPFLSYEIFKEVCFTCLQIVGEDNGCTAALVSI